MPHPLTLLLALYLSMLAQLALPAPDSTCLVIAHRGASGFLPEHTLAAYRLAIEQGADYIELDVILTRDGIPVVRHEPMLGMTTDVAGRPGWEDRHSSRTVQDQTLTNWFADDFSFAELQELRARERLPELRSESASHDGQFSIPSLEQVLQLVAEVKQETGRDVGLYLELKHPAYFRAQNLDITARVIETLARHGLRDADDLVLLQSFDAQALQRAAGMTELPLVQLFYASDREEVQRLVSPIALREVAAYARGIGVPKTWLPVAGPGEPPQGILHNALVENAHRAGLFVHVYTFRAENLFLPTDLRRGADDAAHGDLAAELRRYRDAGVDGFFIDHPAVGREVCGQL
jgi:glycerophosphoryl diester phosphodiesterase